MDGISGVGVVITQHANGDTSTGPNVVKKVGRASKNIRNTPALGREFRKRCVTLGVKYKRLRLVCPTRWNSTYLMLQRAVEFKEIITSLNNENFCDNFLTHDDWKTVNSLVCFLEPFSYVTTALSATYSPTSHLVLEKVHELAMHMADFLPTPELQTMLDPMMAKFLKYYEPFPLVFAMCSILDPRYKLLFTERMIREIHEFSGTPESETKEYMDRVRSLMTDLYKSYVQRLCRHGRPPRPVPTAVPGTRESRAAKMVKTYEESHSDYSQGNLNDLEYYLKSEREPFSENFDILGWWKRYASAPILSHMARDLFTIPASSVPSETAFSEGKKQLSDQRASMIGATLQRVVQLQDWVKAKDRTQDMLDEIQSDEEGYFNLSSSEGETSSSTPMQTDLDEDWW